MAQFRFTAIKVLLICRLSKIVVFAESLESPKSYDLHSDFDLSLGLFSELNDIVFYTLSDHCIPYQTTLLTNINKT